MWRSISAGAAHTCAVSVDGEALCWGWNAFGQLGIGELVGLGTPGTVAGGHQWQSVSSGWHHACGITTAGESYCWGHNRQGQLGSGARTEREPAPVRVAGGIEFTALSGGAQHTCGLAADGTAYCWGLNQYGQLGAHAEPLTETPVVAWPHLKFAQVSAGVGHTCGITRQGTAYCWGKNEDGELGNGSIDPPGLYRVGEPVAIFGGFSLRSITAGNGVSCGVTTAGRGVCWGRGVYGQLGLGSTIGHATPQHVTRVKEFAEVSGSGMTHLCGLTTGNAIYCWGTGERGQLGAGGLTHTLEPVRVTEVR
jgi:alpha-tubulin suppressor-like RCC1 family protein